MAISTAPTAVPQPKEERLKLKVNAQLDDRTRGLIQRRLEKIEWVSHVGIYDHEGTFTVSYTPHEDAPSIIINALITIGYSAELV